MRTVSHQPLRTIPVVLLCGLLIVVPPMPAQAWNERGHMLVAFIAYQHLNPTAKKNVAALLKRNPEYRSWIQGLPATASEDRRALRAFLHAANWPDLIKSAEGYVADGPNGGNAPPPGPEASQNIGYADKNQHRYWHFINLAFSDDGTPTQAPPSVNIRSEIGLLRAALASPSTSEDVKSYDLAWLAHLVGDVHQPLHAVARFTKADRDGDKGGNDVLLKCTGALQCPENLHALWDGLLGSDASPAQIASIGTTLDKSVHPANANVADVNVWIQESVEMARANAYRTISGTPLGDPTATLNKAYIDRARAVARERLVLAGRRLANLINEALGR